MERLKEFLEWHLQNPHNVNLKMIVAKEDREDTLKVMHEISELLDTGLDPDKIQELRERDTAKAPDYEGDGYDNKGEMIYDTWICPNCGKHYEVDYDDYDFCPNCGQRLMLEERRCEK